MKKYIIIAFALIFSLFTLGTGFAVYQLVTITKDLQNLIGLHEIEDIRQQLSFSIQRIQTYTFASTTDFAKNLDEIIANASVVDHTVEKCHDCHHEKLVQEELNDTKKLIEEYEEKLSYLITFVGSAEGPRRQNHQKQVSVLSDIILNKVQGMVNRAGATLTLRTSHAMEEIHQSYYVLAGTLLFTFLAAFFVANSLRTRITKPIDEMLTATNKIANGELGYTTDYQAGKEFGTLISTFNDMSISLASKERKIQYNLNRLNLLNKVTLPLHATHDPQALLNYLSSSMANLLNLEKVGILFLIEENEVLDLTIAATNIIPPNTEIIKLNKNQVLKLFYANKGEAIQSDQSGDKHWPFHAKPESFQIKNYYIHWLRHKDVFSGALFAFNKTDGAFLEEDRNMLGILANNISVALDNISLYKDIQKNMEEIKNTQRQLIEAEKLTALGTLAGGIAHDFNNILCGMIGYLALLKKNHSAGDKDYEMLEIVEKAGFRAASLIKQLLAFSRQEMFELKSLDLNNHIRNVIDLLKNTISKLITIKLELDESLPAVQGDAAQLEQVLMNLCVNARDAMPEGGDLYIKSETVQLDEKFCQNHAESQPGNYVKITVTDFGAGIDGKTLSRIFEPFFTTKEFGKGTGLGLSMVYGIVKSHNGFCLVNSILEHGTTFSVFLPIHVEKTKLQKIPLNENLSAENLGGQTILIADDEEMIVSMLTNHLTSIGCAVMHASNGEEALTTLADQRDKIDLVILDINMPVMGGEEAFFKMKEIKPDLKVLVATGYSLSDHTRKIVDHGAQGYIQKPFDLDDVSAQISKILQS